MKLYVITAKKNLALKTNGAIETGTVVPGKASALKPEKDDVVYIEASSAPALKKSIASVKRKPVPWGILDPKGIVSDPAEYFFLGASDYLGPGPFKKGIDKKRLAAMKAFASRASGGGVLKGSAPLSGKKGGVSLWEGGNSARLQGAAFKGWGSVSSGQVYPFFFFFVSLSGPSSLRGRLGEAGYITLRDRLKNYLQQVFKPVDGLLWMESETTCLLLVPSKIQNVQAALASALRMLLNTPLIAHEVFGMAAIPLEFTLALHYGKTAYKPPGKTGTVVSDAVNFVFHLGHKYAGRGRLTISNEVPEEAVPEGVRDLFVSAGEYEGRTLIHSRRFTRG
ncbi:MAG: hypothetical protein LBI85_02925 [Spirochaetaceae bacterium]|jgi:hypothetical protein|nr:hypothetical protein [Spirochaetaceae bacterium]